MDYSFLYDEDASEEDVLAGYQDLVNTGTAWKLEGHVGRTAMAMIEAGLITLGEKGHRDYWGNYVPSKYEVEPGTKGSQEFVDRMQGVKNWHGAEITPNMVRDLYNDQLEED